MKEKIEKLSIELSKDIKNFDINDYKEGDHFYRITFHRVERLTIVKYFNSYTYDKNGLKSVFCDIEVLNNNSFENLGSCVVYRVEDLESCNLEWFCKDLDDLDKIYVLMSLPTLKQIIQQIEHSTKSLESYKNKYQPYMEKLGINLD